MRLGGTDGTYLLSVILYYVLAGGVGLGMYHFLQDGAFLPSNIANVAMLWGVYFLIAGTPASAGMCFGVAGLFHINHALAGIGLWAGTGAGERLGRGNVSRRVLLPLPVLRERAGVRVFCVGTAERPSPQPSPGVPGEGVEPFLRHRLTQAWGIGTLALLAMSAVQIVPALRVVLSRTRQTPAERVRRPVRSRAPPPSL